MTDEKSPMADQVSARDPNAPKAVANPTTEAEHACFYAGFSRGYEEGCNDLLFALAKGHQWALEKLASVKAEVD